MTIPLAAALAARPPRRPRPAPASTGNRGFARLYIAGTAGSISAFILLAFMVPSAIDRGVPAADAAWLLAFAGASNVGGRLLVPVATTRLGLVPSYRVTFIALAACGPLWMAAGRSLPALTASACLLGAGYGAFVALSPTVAADVLGTSALGRRLGALYTSAGVGALAGPLLAGAATDMTGGYLAAIALAATAGAVGALAVRNSLQVVSGIGC